MNPWLTSMEDYRFRMLRQADEQKRRPKQFAACVFPGAYRSGRCTFIIDESNTVYKRDLGRPGGVDVLPDAETLKKEWTRLD